MPIRSRRRAPVVAIALAFIAVAAPAAGAVIIDDFEVGAFQVVRTGPNPGSGEQIGLDPAHVLGGGREILVGENGSAVQTLTIDAPAGVLRFTPSASFGYFEISYGKPGHFINANLAAAGNAFLLEFGNSAPLPLSRFEVHTSVGVHNFSATQTGATVSPLPGGGFRSIVPFSLLGPNANLTNVQYLRMEFLRVPVGTELVMRHFAVIPEPGGLALLAGALCCGPIARCRTRRA